MTYAKFADFIKNAAVCVVSVLMLLIMLYLSLAAFSGTTDMNMNNEMLENAVRSSDNILVNVLMLLIFCASVFFLKDRVKSIGIKQLKKLLVAVTLILGLVWIISAKSTPTEDSSIVMNTSFAAATGEFKKFTDTSYYKYFPFQLGYVLFNEIIIRITAGHCSYVFFEILNVVFLAVCYYTMLRITELIFSETAQKLTAFLLLFCLQPVLFSTFLYGILPGLCFALLSIWMLIAFMQDKKWYKGLLFALFIAAAVSLKLNYSIVLVAALLILAVYIIKEKQWKAVIALVLALVFTVGIKSVAVKVYETRSGVSLGDGIPIASWAAMGLNESEIAPGWYNYRYTLKNFDKAEMNAEVAGEASKEEIKARLKVFAGDFGYTLNFFTEKVLTQWNEPTYQSIWTNQVRGHAGEPGVIASFVCEDGEGLIKGYMNLYQQMIFAGVLLAAWFCLKRRDLNVTLLLLIILGGFMYHFIFEAKSQYSMPYFIIMIPLAAYGYDSITAVVKKKISEKRG